MRQPNYEQSLDKEGVEWEYLEKVPVDEINATRGKQMQARLEPLDHNLIDSYATMLVDGFMPPPLLLWKPGRCLYIPLDGNQRLAANSQVAAKHKLKYFSAYLVKTEDPMIADRLCWSFNNMVNGRRLSYEECINHAITFVRKYNLSNEKSARMWSVKEWELKARTTELELIDLANRHKISIPNGMAVATLLDFSPLRRIGDDITAKAIGVAASIGMTHEDARTLVKKVQAASTNDAKIKVIDDFASSEQALQRKAETQGGRSKPSPLPRIKLQRALDAIANILSSFTDKKAFAPVGSADQKEYHAVGIMVVNDLIKIYGLGKLLNGGG